jgi:lysozyme family protein
MLAARRKIKMTPAEKRLAMGKAIVEFEGRYKDGKLQWYKLPAGDGGGEYEVAGINQKYHPAKAAQLKRLIDNAQHDAAEREAAAYIEEYTRGVLRFFPSPQAADANPHIEFVLRDIGFNRGVKGAATVLQLALGVTPIDGIIGPMSYREFARQLEFPGAKNILERLTQARETYERNVFAWKTQSRDESSKFWRGLSNRWTKCHEVATTRFT